MSSFKNAQKSNQKQHRERGQLASRKKYGLLEKKKDYKQRADDYQRKQKTLKALKRRALNRNPDEFHFKMVKTHLEDGVHQCEDETPQYTDTQLALMTSQDLNYVTYKASCERKKVERMQASLHRLEDVETVPNKHIIFKDSRKEVKEFDAAKHFDTHPALLSRKYNRPTSATLQSDFQEEFDEETLIKSVVERKKQYLELERRQARLKQLDLISQKLNVKKELKHPKQPRKTKVKEETTTSAAVYEYAPQRKR